MKAALVRRRTPLVAPRGVPPSRVAPMFPLPLARALSLSVPSARAGDGRGGREETTTTTTTTTTIPTTIPMAIPRTSERAAEGGRDALEHRSA